VLEFPDFGIEKGKIYAVIGGNGSGKSTFGRVLSGIIRADGKVKPIEAAVSVGYMPQKSYAFSMSVEKNITVGCDDSEDIKRRSHKLMERLELTQLKNQKGKRLSGGETEKTALARILMHDYDIIVLDEPTAAMDISSGLAAEELIREYSEKNGSAVILITHSIKQAQRISDSVLFFCDGNLLEYGDTKTVLASPQREETKKFLDFYGV